MPPGKDWVNGQTFRMRFQRAVSTADCVNADTAKARTASPSEPARACSRTARHATAASLSIRTAGNDLDAALVGWLKKEHALMLGERTAEDLKLAAGSAWPFDDEPDVEVRGRDLASGLPRTLVLTTAEVRQALEEPVTAIVDAVRTTLDQTPPELAGDIMDRGIVLTGGGALLRGLDERLSDETGMPVHVADHPLTSVALGAGRCVEHYDALQQVLVTDRRRSA